MSRLVATVIAAIGLVGVSYGQWTADFTVDGDADGFAEFQNGNPGKDMFDPSGASGGRLFVQTQDGIGYDGAHDKGGRLLGVLKNTGTESVSAYFKYNWAQLAETSADVASAVQFLSDGQVHISREAVGTLMRFRKTGADYEVNLGLQFAGVGISYNGYKGGESYTNLGPDAVGKEMQLVISWDAATRVLQAALYDMNGALLGSNSGDLDTDPGFADDIALLGPATLTAELNATNLKYLGWQDYIWNANNQTILWDVDTVAWYDTAGGAFAAVVPEPSALLLACVLLPFASTRRRRS